MAWRAKKTMAHNNCCKDTLDMWPSVFTAMSIISNRETPFHRDSQSRMCWYDILTSVGPYNDAPVYLSPFGIRISNTPGTICAFSGMALRHAVRYTAQPRISIASYLRENVRAGAHVQPAGWMSQSVYRNITGYSQFRR